MDAADLAILARSLPLPASAGALPGVQVLADDAGSPEAAEAKTLLDTLQK